MLEQPVVCVYILYISYTGGYFARSYSFLTGTEEHCRVLLLVLANISTVQ